MSDGEFRNSKLRGRFGIVIWSGLIWSGVGLKKQR